MTTLSPKTASGLTAFFETRADAERALDRLRSAGIAEPHLHLTGSADDDDTAKPPGRGVLDALGKFFLPQRDAGARDGCLVTVSDLPADRQDVAARLLHEAGGANVSDETARNQSDASDSGQTRPVQPGFTDVAPGFVPKTAEFPPSRTAGEHQAPDEVADSKGRFAEQLDRLPENERARDPSGDRNG